MIDPIKQIIVVRKDLIEDPENPMTPGKLAVQVAHASMAPLLEIARGKPYEEVTPRKGPYSLILNLEDGQPLKEWLEKDFRKIVLYVKSEEKLLNVYKKLKEAGFIVSLIKDAGLTVFNEPTITCFGVEPLHHSVINPYVKKLQLLK
jgi:PTH2 family peptidyl-tRNA hydrolase